MAYVSVSNIVDFDKSPISGLQCTMSLCVEGCVLGSALSSAVCQLLTGRPVIFKELVDSAGLTEQESDTCIR